MEVHRRSAGEDKVDGGRQMKRWPRTKLKEGDRRSAGEDKVNRGRQTERW